MSGLFGVLDVAARGLQVAQQGVRNTSNNIANVNTPGYSRQRQVVVPSTPIANPSGNIGTGAEQISIDRVADVFVQAQIVKQNGFLGSVDVQASALSAIEQVVNEQQGAGVGAALSRLYDSFSGLASSQTPGAPVEREEVRAAAQTVIDILSSTDTRLRDQQRAVQSSIAAIVPEINELTSRIADLNREIVVAEGIAPANELRDQRDLAVRMLAEKIEVDTFMDGSAQVVLLRGGAPLVESTSSHNLVLVADTGNPFDPSFSRIGFETGGNPVDVTDDIGGGELGGLLRIRDTTLPAAIRSLDTIAYSLAESVNAIHAAGVGLDGISGNFFAALPAVEDAARDLVLDTRILGSPDAIAAGFSTAPGDNQNAADLAELRSAVAPIFLPGDPPGPASGPPRTLLDHTAGIVSDIGQQSSAMQSAQAQEARVSEILANRRDEISGVSIDEEVTQLVQLQAAFQANARVMQTVDRLLEDVLALI